MPSLISHTVAGIAAGCAIKNEKTPARLWFLSILSSLLPDADLIGYYFHVPYEHFFGHRGFFHSPFFGLLWSILLVSLFFRKEKIFSKYWFRYVLFFFTVTASHGLLDAFTDGGLGIALLSPLSNARYFFPWTPIVVSPLSIRMFFGDWGIAVIKSEALWVWLPSFLAVAMIRLIRKWPGRRINAVE